MSLKFQKNVDKSIKVPSNIASKLTQLESELIQQGYRLSGRAIGYYFPQFTGNRIPGSPPAIGLPVGSSSIVLKLLDSNKTLEYSTELLGNAAASGMIKYTSVNYQTTMEGIKKESQPLKENYLRFFKKFTHLDGQGKKVLKEEQFKPGSHLRLNDKSHKQAVDLKRNKIEGSALVSFADYPPDQIYVFLGYDGSNARVFPLNGNRSDVISANQGRFEVLEPDTYSSYGEMDAPTSI